MANVHCVHSLGKVDAKQVHFGCCTRPRSENASLRSSLDRVAVVNARFLLKFP